MEKSLTEQIGKVNLDFTYYAGKDIYCDGEIEDELLKIARDYAEVEYPRIIEEKKSWEVFYHLSEQRKNIVEWLPMNKETKVLEVGSGCGAITGILSEKAGSVTCIDLSKKRSMINAYRHMDRDNILIQVGNFQDIEPSLPCDYDYICLIGVLEYGQAYIQGEAPFETFLTILKKHLKKNGRIIIAIENKFGLKYWAGCREDHLGTFFSGLENYPDGGVVRTFTRTGLEKLFANCGIEDYSFYYPYPDYKFMTMLYSDEYLPERGELSNNLRNFDRDRMMLFDEKKVFDTVIEEGLFPLYSNSYLVVIGEKPDAMYVKYSNDRRREYQIRTEIRPIHLAGMEGRKEVPEIAGDYLPDQIVVRKYPLYEEAGNHIRDMDVAYKKLKERYVGSELKINRCKLVDRDEGEKTPYVELEFVPGFTLSELLDACLYKNDMNGFQKLFQKYLDILDFRSEMPVADYDMIFSNILVSIKDVGKPFDALENSVWTLIDYEWTFSRQMSKKELAFRALYCYMLEYDKRGSLDFDHLMSELQITDNEAEEYREQERTFQRFVTGNQRSMVEIRNLIGHECFWPESFLEKMRWENFSGRIQVYLDKGEGFREEDSFFPTDSVTREGDDLNLSLTIEAGMKQVRIDPAFTDCIVHVKKISFNDLSLDILGKKSVLTTNGTGLDETGSFVFPTEDPNMVISLEGLPFEEENFLDVCFERSFVSREMAEHVEKAAKRRLRL